MAFSSLWRAAAGPDPGAALPDYANLDILGGYLGYVLLGWLLTTTERTPSKGLCTAGFLAGLLVTAGGTWFMTRRAGELNGVFLPVFHAQRGADGGLRLPAVQGAVGGPGKRPGDPAGCPRCPLGCIWCTRCF